MKSHLFSCYPAKKVSEDVWHLVLSITTAKASPNIWTPHLSLSREIRVPPMSNSIISSSVIYKPQWRISQTTLPDARICFGILPPHWCWRGRERRGKWAEHWCNSPCLSAQAGWCPWDSWQVTHISAPSRTSRAAACTLYPFVSSPPLLHMEWGNQLGWSTKN